MLTCDTSELEKQLAEFHKEAIRKLEGMVQKFSIRLGSAAAMNTPLGDERKFLDYYLNRQADTGLYPIKGFARGSWRMSFNQTDKAIQEYYGADSYKYAIDEMEIDAKNYKLGNAVLISNIGPYIVDLETAPWSIHKGEITGPTLQLVYSAYQMELDDYYKKA